MRTEGETQVKLVHKVANAVEGLRVPLLVILVVTVVGVVAYFAYAQISAAGRERAAVLMEQADALLADWQSEQDATKKARLEGDLQQKLDALSRSSGFAAQRSLYLRGQWAAEKGDKQAAFDAFNALASSASRSYLGIEGLVNSAVFAEDLGKTDVALDLYKQIVDKHAGSAHAAHAQFSVGRLLEAKGDFKGAAAAYSDLRSRHPSGTWTNLAVNRIIALQASGKVGKN
jgi:hypothetical protein